MQGTVLQNLPTQRFDSVLLANKFRPSDSQLVISGAVRVNTAACRVMLKSDTGVLRKQRLDSFQINTADSVWDQVRAHLRQNVVCIEGRWRGQATQVKVN